MRASINRFLTLSAILGLYIHGVAQPFAANTPVASASIGKPDDAVQPIDAAKWRLHKDLGKEKIYRAKGRVILVLRDGARGRMGKKGFFSRRMKGSMPLAENAEMVSFNEDSASFESIHAELMSHPEVTAVEPDLRIRASGLTGSFVKATDIDLTGAQHRRSRIRRPAQKPGRKVRVGILDTGIDYLHPDLKNEVEHGVNLIYVKPEVQLPNDEASDNTEMDYNGHGTQVAGIIGAEHNDIGIDGLSEARLVGIKAFNDEGEGRLSDVLAGIQWAMDNGIDVLNMSCGTYEYSAAFQKMVSKAQAKGMIVVAAAGNDHAGEAAYPAKFTGVLSVGSENEKDQVSDFSNFGPEVGFFAPGERILSTALHRDSSPYKVFNGTSASCAHVSGLIAEGISEGLDPASVVSILRKTAERKLAFFAPGDPDFLSVDQDGFLSTLRKEDFARLTLEGLGANRLIWKVGDEIKMDYRIQNTGTKSTATAPLSLRVEVGEIIYDTPLHALPSLKAGEIFDGSVTFPKKISQGPMVANVSLNLGGSSAVKLEGFENTIPLTVLDENRVRLYASSMWLNNLEPGKAPGRKLMIKVMNIGNAQTPGVNVVPQMQEGGHCEYGRINADIVGAGVPMGALKPGEYRNLEIDVPDMDIPSKNSFTVMAAFMNGADTLYRPKKQMEAFRKGFLKLFYSQEVHRWIAQEAVNLLKLQGVFIPDLMGGTKPYLGGVTPYFDIDEKTQSMTPHPDTWWTPQTMAGYTHFTLVNGAHDADEADITFHYTGSDLFDTHFWKVDQDDHTGHTYGTLGHHHHSALDRIRALMYGNTLVTDSYITKGALDHYRAGYKDAAWYFMGHIVHLIGDMSVPSHIDDANWHGIWGDGYHDWMDHGYYDDFGSAQIAYTKFGGMIDPYQSAAVGDPVRFLTYTTAQVGGAYSYGNANRNPVNHDYGGTGNRNALGDSPHYDAYMAQVYTTMKNLNREIGLPDVHPVTFNDIAQVEALNKGIGSPTCEWTTSICTGFPCYESLSDCEDNNGHIDQNNTYSMDANADRDLEAIARMNINYAIRAAAGMIYYFAKETNQIRYPALPAIITLLLQ